MPRIEDYAIIGDCQTAALVGSGGSIDWLCLPRFDSAACFAALLGDANNGRWLVAPCDDVVETRRHYRGDTLILETDYRTADGEVTVIDFMPPRTDVPDLCRIVVGKRGRVRMRTEIVLRFEYGKVIPWVRSRNHGLIAIAGPDLIHLDSGIELHGEDFKSVAEFDVAEGDRVSFIMCWARSYEQLGTLPDPEELLQPTERWWTDWVAACSYEGPWREAVVRSLITLKALTYEPTGGIVAAPTTSLPERIGGSRNWDYRYCWIRDATFTLYALLQCGFDAEACAWRDWLVRAVAGMPSQIQALYGIAGERRLHESEIPWLSGYEGSRPVRIGNGAHQQFQLDVFGELMDAMHFARRSDMEPEEDAWRVQRALIEHLEDVWREPDEGIWEVRGGRRHFVHSKVMAWVAFDRAVKAVERFGLPGDAERWRGVAETIRADVCDRGYDAEIGSFVQSYGSREVDASLLMLPLVGFVPARDPRMVGTVDAIQKHLCPDGLVRRYRTEGGIDGFDEEEGIFFLCSFWLVDNLALIGRTQQARELFERLLGLRNDVGLLAEEYDPRASRQIGNFPQAYSHVALINSAWNLTGDWSERPSEDRAAD